MDGEFFNDAEDVRGGDVVERVLVFLLEATAEVFGCDVTRFAVAQIASGTLAKCDEAGMREAEDYAFSVHGEFAIHGVTVASGDRVPAMRKTAVVNEIGNFRGHVESTDKFAHRARVGIVGYGEDLAIELGYFLPPTTAGWADC